MAARIPVQPAPPLPTRAQWDAYVATLPPTHVPPNQLCVEDIEDWKIAEDALRHAKNREIVLRTKIFKFLFPMPVEGTNKVQLEDGRIVEAAHKIARSVDEAQWGTLCQLSVGQVREEVTKLGFDVKGHPDNAPLLHALGMSRDLVKWKPDVNITLYRTLTNEQRLYFERVLEIKPGSPTVKVVVPKAEE